MAIIKIDSEWLFKKAVEARDNLKALTNKSDKTHEDVDAARIELGKIDLITEIFEEENRKTIITESN